MNISVRDLAFLVLALVAPGSLSVVDSHAQSSRFAKWLVHDPVGIVNDWTLEQTVGVVGATTTAIALSSMDHYVRDGVQPLYAGEFRSYIDIANELGGPRATAPVVGIFLLSLGTNNDRFQDAAFTSLEALVYSGALNYAVKFASGRYRPEEERGRYTFRPFSGNTSFPSGHTNAAFAILTPWVIYYPSPVTYGLLFVAAGGTGFSRIARSRHWASDTFIGGVMGAFIGYQLAKQHKYQEHLVKDKPVVALRPIIGPGFAGLGATINLSR